MHDTRGPLSRSGPSLDGKRLLVVVAAPIEAAAVRAGWNAEPMAAAAPNRSWALDELSPNADLLECGVGKSNAAGAVARFADPGRHALVLNLGIAGWLGGDERSRGDEPTAWIRPIGRVVVSDRSVFADEGVETPDGFIGVPELGFPFAPGVDSAAMPVDPLWMEWFGGFGDLTAGIATVSACSGRDGRAEEIRARTGCVAEAMEGAAAGLAALRVGIGFSEVRVISNTTGDRSDQQWDVRAAVARLRGLAASVASGVGRLR